MQVRMIPLLIGALCGMGWAAMGAEGFRVGVARRVITPEEPMWLAGYASRNRPSEGKVHDLYAKALVIQDARGERVVIVTTDLIGLSRDLSETVAVEVRRRFGLSREHVCLTSSHTHSGPALADSLVHIYPMSREEAARVKAYSKQLPGKLLEVITEAMGRLEPARISYGIGRAHFAVNRRNNSEKDAAKKGFKPKGPVDHDVPVLRVSDTQGNLKAVLFGYACHCTTMNFYKWCGDYAGFAQLNLEQAHPGATAMFVAGCGGDINPLPRRKLELCEDYGRQLSDAVEPVLAGAMTPITGHLRAVFKRIDLPFEKAPSRGELEAERAAAEAEYVRRAIDLLLARMDARQPLPASYPYPIQLIQFGDDLTMVILGGEALVDYSLWLKDQLGRDCTWVISYANDVCAYIPPRRVLAEGGYEGETSMRAYGKPARWDPAIEEMIIGTVRELAGQVRGRG